jgi:TRAP-type mannitol/chloroaromatic compound transport system substrate-binding protein
MAHKKSNYEVYREKALKDPVVKKIYEEGMSKYLAEEAAKAVEEAKRQLDVTYRRLKALIREAS